MTIGLLVLVAGYLLYSLSHFSTILNRRRALDALFEDKWTLSRLRAKLYNEAELDLFLKFVESRDYLWKAASFADAEIADAIDDFRRAGERGWSPNKKRDWGGRDCSGTGGLTVPHVPGGNWNCNTRWKVVFP